MSNSKPLYIQALEGLRRREGLYRIFIFTLVTVGFWIGFSIFFSQQKTKVSIDILKHTEPLNPNINKETLEELATRKRYNEQELENFPLYDRVVGEDKISKLIIAGSESEETTVQIEDTPEIIDTPSATQSASPSATPETTPEATSSGNL